MNGSSDVRDLSVFLAFVILWGALALPAIAAEQPPSGCGLSPGDEGCGGARSYTDRAPIKIIGDLNFTSANGVAGGDGSESNPYLIQDWRITRNNTAQQAMIYIGDTSKHFVVRGCSLEGNRSANFSLICTGVELHEVHNATIENCRVNGTDTGIQLEGPASDFLVRNCTIGNDRSGNGIKLRKAGAGSIENCTIRDCDYGISGEAQDSVFKGNVIHDCTHGLSLYQSSGNTIQGNHVHDNSNIGISLQGSGNNTIANNTVHDLPVGYGIRLSTASGNAVTGNNITTTMQGISVTGDRNSISANRIADYLGFGINIYGKGNRIFLNFVKGPAGYNAADFEGDNEWNSTEKGNYWSDYAGYDANSDGIGDVPHPIRAGSPNSQITGYDHRPIMAEPGAPPNTPPLPVALSFSNLSENYVRLSWTRSNESDFWQYAIIYSLDNATWSLVANVTDINSTDSLRGGALAMWSNALTPDTTYNVLVRLFDRGGLFSDSNKVTFHTKAQEIPRPVVININASRMACRTGEEITFTAEATSPTGAVSYHFDFGDGSTSGWIANSSVSHRYGRAGSYNIIVRAWIPGGAESDPFQLPRPVAVTNKPAGKSKSFIPGAGIVGTLLALGLVSAVFWRAKRA